MNYIYLLTPKGISQKQNLPEFYAKKDERIRRVKKRVRKPK